jgi:hypothetical protein
LLLPFHPAVAAPLLLPLAGLFLFSVLLSPFLQDLTGEASPLLALCQLGRRSRLHPRKRGGFLLLGLVVTDVPKVPIWKAVDFNVLRRGMCGNSLISGKRQLFQLNTRSSATEGAWRSRFDL